MTRSPQKALSTRASGGEGRVRGVAARGRPAAPSPNPLPRSLGRGLRGDVEYDSPARTLPRDHGFTLIEVIVALVVLGFVLAGLAQATRFGMNAWSLETRLADHASELERVDRTLRQIIEQACAPVGGDDKPFAGQEHRMVFITTLPAQPQTDPIRRAQVALGIDDAHHLVLRWQQQPNAVLIGNKPEQHEIILADGLERIDLAYRQNGADGGKWSKTWTDGSLPALVQIHFVLSNTKHKWPDIAIATMLDSNGSF